MRQKSQAPQDYYKLPKQWRDLAPAKNASKLLFALLAFFAATITTQILAHTLHYRGLGEPQFPLNLYSPFQGASWCVKLMQYGVRGQEVVIHTLYVLGFWLLVAAGLTAFAYRKMVLNAKGPHDKYGSAQPASAADIEKMRKDGLFSDDDGVYICSFFEKNAGFLGLSHRSQYLRHDGEGHILVVAPTGSGKTAGIVIPTCLTYASSMLIHDIKGEIYQKTAGWRHEKLGSICLKFDPTCKDGSSCRFNPLEEIRLRTEEEIKDVQNLVQIITDPDGKGFTGQDVHFVTTGASLLNATILHVLYTQKDKTLKAVGDIMSDPSRHLSDLFQEMKTAVHDDSEINPETGLYARGWTDSQGNPTRTHPFIAQSAQDMIDKSEMERTSVVSTCKRFLTLYRDPIIARNIQCSDFRITDLQDPSKIVTLYLKVPPSDKDRLKPLIRLILNQVIRKLVEEQKDDARELLVMADEFASLGKLAIFEESLAYVRGYKIRVCLIIQDYAQLEGAYGKDESITSNCQCVVAYAPNKYETAKKISDLLGVMTVRTSRKGPKQKGAPKEDQFEDTRRELMTPDEVRRLNPDDAIVICEGRQPIFAKKIKYYKDPVFLERSAIKAPPISDKVFDGSLTEKPRTVAQPAQRGPSGGGNRPPVGRDGSADGPRSTRPRPRVTKPGQSNMPITRKQFAEQMDDAEGDGNSSEFPAATRKTPKSA